MQDFPHHYVAEASAESDSDVKVTSPGIEPLVSAGPAEFGGPGDKWSPETMLVAAIADCFVLTFRAIARASRLTWISLACNVVGELDRVDGVTRFTRIRVRATLDVPDQASRERAEKLLVKSERHCLITNSMTATSELETEVRIGGAVS